MLKSEREGLVWLAQKNSGSTVKEISARVGRATRTVRHNIQRARQRYPQFCERIRLIMNGVVGECRHGLPVLRANGDTTWVCIDCAATNNPDHPAFYRGVPLPKPSNDPAKFKPKGIGSALTEKP